MPVLFAQPVYPPIPDSFAKYFSGKNIGAQGETLEKKNEQRKVLEGKLKNKETVVDLEEIDLLSARFAKMHATAQSQKPRNAQGLISQKTAGPVGLQESVAQNAPAPKIKISNPEPQPKIEAKTSNQATSKIRNSNKTKMKVAGALAKTSNVSSEEKNLYLLFSVSNLPRAKLRTTERQS